MNTEIKRNEEHHGDKKSGKRHGKLLGIPYDWRRPTLQRLKRRWWNPEGPMLTPKLWGWGWDLNLRHPGSWVLLCGMLVMLVTLTCGS
ncbi:MAG: hypothetical protein KC502_09415 [Myxococcales bacterium]|nr:hypothetical protein [Myxococcales bacterium]